MLEEGMNSPNIVYDFMSKIIHLAIPVHVLIFKASMTLFFPNLPEDKDKH